MPSGYHHLGYDERIQIEVLKSMGLSIWQVAKRLGRSTSTISRELRRNQGGESYKHGQAKDYHRTDEVKRHHVLS